MSEQYCSVCGALNTTTEGSCFSCGSSLKTTGVLHDVEPEQEIHGYRLLEIVGKGGYSTVHKARRLQDGQLVAIKVVSLSGLTAQQKIEATDTFNREVRLLSHLRQRNLPRMYEHFSDTEAWYLVMDFIDGRTLESHLEQRPSRFPIQETLDLAMVLCDVLAYLHSRQPAIIFRDLKPSNILLTHEGHLFLIDFGIARYFKPGQMRDTIPFGSPGYAAPEQYGRAQTTTTADIYSLGAILHQLLTGDDPAASPFSFASLPESSEEMRRLQQLLQRMLALDIQERPQTIGEVHQELAQIAQQHNYAGLQALPSPMLWSPLPYPTTIQPIWQPASSATITVHGGQMQIFYPQQQSNIPSAASYAPNRYAIVGLVFNVVSLIILLYAVLLLPFMLIFHLINSTFFFAPQTILCLLPLVVGVYCSWMGFSKARISPKRYRPGKFASNMFVFGMLLLTCYLSIAFILVLVLTRT